MLREVWTNLISNALKYSRNNPQRAVTITGEIVDTLSQYSIRDNGVGFDMTYGDSRMLASGGAAVHAPGCVNRDGIDR